MNRSVKKSQVVILMYARVRPSQHIWRDNALNMTALEQHLEYFCSAYEILSPDEPGQIFNQDRYFPGKVGIDRGQRLPKGQLAF